MDFPCPRHSLYRRRLVCFDRRRAVQAWRMEKPLRARGVTHYLARRGGWACNYSHKIRGGWIFLSFFPLHVSSHFPRELFNARIDKGYSQFNRCLISVAAGSGGRPLKKRFFFTETTEKGEKKKEDTPRRWKWKFRAEAERGKPPSWKLFFFLPNIYPEINLTPEGKKFSSHAVERN